MHRRRDPGKPQRVRWRFAHKIEFLLLLAGLVCLGWYVYAVAERSLYQSYENYRLSAEIQGEDASLPGYVGYLIYGEVRSSRSRSEERATYGSETSKGPEQPKKRVVPAGGLIGRIEIPRLKVSAVVKEGADTKTLKN